MLITWFFLVQRQTKPNPSFGPFSNGLFFAFHGDKKKAGQIVTSAKVSQSETYGHRPEIGLKVILTLSSDAV